MRNTHVSRTEVAGATSHAMLVVTTISASTIYALSGAILWHYAAVAVVISLITTFAGQIAANKVVAASGRASLVAFMVSAFLGVSAVLALYLGVVTIMRSAALGTLWVLGRMCAPRALTFAQMATKAHLGIGAGGR